MAKIELRPIDKNDKAGAIEALMNYKKQNPVKFEAKKTALFAKYGIEDTTVIDPVEDDTDKKLKKAKKEAEGIKGTVTE